MRITFELQDVEFEFNIDSAMRLGRVTDMLGRFAMNRDRELRQEHRGIDNHDEPLIRPELTNMADRIKLRGVTIKDTANPTSVQHILVWDQHRKIYLTVADSTLHYRE